jgi:hypothetical protein
MARTGLKLRLRMSLEDFENAKKKGCDPAGYRMVMIILLVMRPLESSFLKIVFLFIAIPKCSWASMMARGVGIDARYRRIPAVMIRRRCFLCTCTKSPTTRGLDQSQ